MNRRQKSARRVWTALLALLLVLQSVAFPRTAEAKKKELALEPGYYVRWKRGLPPRDGKWYRTMLAGPEHKLRSYYILRGNTVAEIGKADYKSNVSATGRRGTVCRRISI